jgi:hypothetical protein
MQILFFYLCKFGKALFIRRHHDDSPMKTLKISESLHSQLRIESAGKGCSLQSLAETFLTKGLADLLKRKQATTGNPLRLRKGGRV